MKTRTSTLHDLASSRVPHQHMRVGPGACRGEANRLVCCFCNAWISLREVNRVKAFFKAHAGCEEKQR